MAGLQRSVVSFRRQGSSGLVWDDKLNQLIQQQEQENDKLRAAGEQDPAAAVPTKNSSPLPEITIERSRSNGGGRGFRTGRVSPAIEPPSPKVSACGLCSAFGKHDKNRRRRLPPPRPGKRVM